MSKKSMGEVVMSMLFALVGCGGIVIIQLQKFDALSNTGTTDFRTMPTFAGTMLVLLSLVNGSRVLIGEYQRRMEAAQDRDGQRQGERVAEEQGEQIQGENCKSNNHDQVTRIRVILMFLLCLAVAILMKALPFPILVFGFLFLAFLVLGQKKIWINAMVSLLGSGLVYLIFIVLLKLPL